MEKAGTVETVGKCEACRKPWDRFRGKRRCPTCGVPSLICKDCFDLDANGTKKLGKDVRCELCVEEMITHKAQIWDREKQELADYEAKQKQIAYEKRAAKKEEKDANKANGIEEEEEFGEDEGYEKKERAGRNGREKGEEGLKDLTSGLKPEQNTNHTTKLWIGNLHTQKVGEKSLATAIPNIKFVQWINEGATGKWKGCCFAEMNSAEDAALAVAAGKAEKKLFGRQIRINYQETDSRSRWPPPNAVYFE